MHCVTGMQALQRPPSYLQTVVQGKVLVALVCGEQQVTGPLRLASLVPGYLSVLGCRRLQVLPDADKLLAGLHQLREKPETHISSSNSREREREQSHLCLH